MKTRDPAQDPLPDDRGLARERLRAFTGQGAFTVREG